jgi:hypothetical protein
MRRRLALVATLTAVLSPVTGAGLLLACAYLRGGAAVPQDVYMTYFRHLVVPFIMFGALPAALFAAVGLSALATLRARGLAAHTLLLLGAVLGAACGLLVTVAALVGPLPPKRWALAAALNGAMWGLLVAGQATKGRAARGGVHGMLRLALVVVLLLASVGTASAECAWAFWVRNESGWWRRPIAYSNRDECWQDITTITFTPSERSLDAKIGWLFAAP